MAATAPECATCNKLCLTKGEARQAAAAWNRRELSHVDRARPRRMEAYRCPHSTNWWHIGNNRPRKTKSTYRQRGPR